VLGWTATGDGILMRQQQLDSHSELAATRIFSAPVGVCDALHLVETIQSSSQLLQLSIRFALPSAA